MTRIVQISDTHFGTEVAEVLAALGAAIEELKPDVVILSGDITQRARNSQFAAAKAFMDSLLVPVKLAVPGNHDIPLFNPFLRLFAPYRNYQKAFGATHGVWSDDTVSIVLYDATSRWRHTRGKLSKRDALKPLKNLQRAGIVIAVAHQPLKTAWAEDIHETLIGRTDTAQLWAEQKVDMVLSGHVHVPILATTQNKFPTLPYHFILTGAGTAVSRRVRAGAANSFNVINAANVELSVAVHEFDATQGRFTPLHPVTFTRNDAGWQEKQADK